MANTTRAQRPENKIAVKDFEALSTYCKGVEGATPTSVIGNLVKETTMLRPPAKHIPGKSRKAPRA